MSQYTNRKYNNSNISSPRTMLWMEKEQKQLLIQSRFSAVNQSIRDRADHNTQVNHQLATSKQIILQFEEKIDKDIQGFQKETNALRDKVQNISKRMKEFQIARKEKASNLRQKIKDIKMRTEIELVKQRYASQNTIGQIQQYFQKMITIFQSDETIKAPQLSTRLKQLNAQLHQQMPVVKKQIQTVSMQNENYLENIANELEKKIGEFKKRMIAHSFSDQQSLKQLNEHIYKAKGEIDKELKIQRDTREQNKEKILMLFQIKIEKQTTKSK